jgi:hypothetical protein
VKFPAHKVGLRDALPVKDVTGTGMIQQTIPDSTGGENDFKFQ